MGKQRRHQTLTDMYSARPSARRQREADALDMLRRCRTDLWPDLIDLLEVNPRSPRAIRLVTRIRDIGVFLGGPSAWEAVPVPWLKWYVFVEDVPDQFLHAETPDWEDLADVDFEPVDLQAIDTYDNVYNMRFEDWEADDED